MEGQNEAMAGANAMAGAENNPTKTDGQAQAQLDPFDEFLKDPKNQSTFDKRVQTAIDTAKAHWEDIANTEKSEAEKLAKMNKEQKLEYEANKTKQENEKLQAQINAYEMKNQAVSMASAKGLDVSLLDLIDFKTVTAEKLNENIDNLSTLFNKAVEKAVNDKLKEGTPTTKTTGLDGNQIKPIPTVF